MDRGNQELIAKAKQYIDQANALNPEVIHELFADDAVYVDSTGLSGQPQSVIGKGNIYEGHKNLYLALRKGHWEVREEDYVETQENVIEFFLNATLSFKESSGTQTFKGVERIAFSNEGQIIHISGAGFFSQERSRLV